MLPNSPNLIGSHPLQDGKPDNPDRLIKNPELTRIRYKGKVCVNLMHNIVSDVKLHLG